MPTYNNGYSEVEPFVDWDSTLMPVPNNNGAFGFQEFLALDWERRREVRSLWIEQHERQSELLRQNSELRKQSMEFERKNNTGYRLFLLALALVFAGVIIAILILFRDEPDTIVRLIPWVVGGLVAVALCGYFIGKPRRNS